ncbi:MAG: hypothetical protein WCS92_05870 [Candidatus Babeliales bacterium]
MNILKNYIRLSLVFAYFMVFFCSAETSKNLAEANTVEVTSFIGAADVDDSECLFAELNSITENILATFDKSIIKNNKADLIGTALAIGMMMSYASIGAVSPHVASSATLVHAASSMLNQKIKNSVYLDRAENIEEFKKNIQLLIAKDFNGLYAKNMFKITNLIEKKILSEVKSKKRAFWGRVITSMPFIIGYFIFSEFNATSKLYPEILNEVKNLIKANNPDKNRALTEAENQVAEIQAGVGVSVEALLRLAFGFSSDGKYYMYPWLIGAVLEVINFYYINSSNSNSSKVELSKLKEIKKLLSE